MAHKKEILIINTGGTISGVKTKHGYSPEQGYIVKQLKNIREFSHPDMPHYNVIEYQPLFDSVDITAKHWNQIANDVYINYHDYDGFVILHGTDTMAYTASALSFILNGIQKPVILTGSQIPLSELRNDAKINLINSMLIAANCQIPEVCVCFNNKLFRGNRVRKVNALNYDAFSSPNYPKLATIGINIELHNKFIMPMENKQLKLELIKEVFIANFRLFPGASTKILQNFLYAPLQGLILETYGIGNAPQEKELFDLLKQAVNENIIIINCTQCPKGSVNMQTYAAGNHLLKAGVISGFDLTPEAAHCKLLYLLSRDYSINKVRDLMATNLAGEMREVIL